jgi:hypothetical protein
MPTSYYVLPLQATRVLGPGGHSNGSPCELLKIQLLSNNCLLHVSPIWPSKHPPTTVLPRTRTTNPIPGYLVVVVVVVGVVAAVDNS